MTDELKDKIKKHILDLIKEYHGKKRFKQLDLEKDVVEVFGNENITRKDAKSVIRELTENNDLVYGYAGGSFLTLPEDKS